MMKILIALALVVILGRDANAQEIPDSLRLYYKALTYDGIDPKKGLDTMMAYCEQHPFALYGDGQWFRAFKWVGTFSNDYWFIVLKEAPQDAPKYWPGIYNWLIKIQPLNSDSLYQKQVLSAAASVAERFDRNLAVNLWYTFIHYFGSDTLYKRTAYNHIFNTRRAQMDESEDTTDIQIYDLPLQPVSGVGTVGQLVDAPGLSISPNPVRSSATVTFSLKRGGQVEIGLFDASGRLVRDVLNTVRPVGEHRITADLGGLPSGGYLLRLTDAGGGAKAIPVIIE
jgi:hypothetical protein